MEKMVFSAAVCGQVYGQETAPGAAASLWSCMDNVNSILTVSSVLLFESVEKVMFP